MPNQLKINKMRNLIQEYSVASQYFAPRGRDRLVFLGGQISQYHLNFNDRLIGFVGDAGSGKSSLIKGMFPGLSLSNDDDTLDMHSIMQVRDLSVTAHEASTYHIDMRFQVAFTQMYEIVDFVNELLEKDKRIIIEHFNLIYPALGRNADLMVGIGEEIIVTRPSIFGPVPNSIYEIVHQSLKWRKMAHTFEDITIMVLEEELKVPPEIFYSSDIRNGFVLRFIEKIEIDFDRLSDRVSEIIKADLPVSYLNEDHIMIGDTEVWCTGPRLHVSKTSKVEEYTIIKRFIEDLKNNTHCLVGLVGDGDCEIKNRNTLHFSKKK